LDGEAYHIRVDILSHQVLPRPGENAGDEETVDEGWKVVLGAAEETGRKRVPCYKKDTKPWDI
jgi:hypothetical protein